MDTTALSLCMDNDLPIHVFELAPGNIGRVLAGESVGTLISTPSEGGTRVTAIDDFVADATQRMNKSVEATHEHFNSVRTGRASAALLDRIQIDYYGTPSPLKNIATINVPGGAAADDPAVRPLLDQADRAGDPGVEPRPDAVERRQDHPAADPAADRGAAQGARQARPQHGRGGPRRGAQRPPRRDAAPRGARQERRCRRRRGARRRGAASRSSPTTTSTRSTSS